MDFLVLDSFIKQLVFIPRILKGQRRAKRCHFREIYLKDSCIHAGAGYFKNRRVILSSMLMIAIEMAVYTTCKIYKPLERIYDRKFRRHLNISLTSTDDAFCRVSYAFRPPC